MEKESLHFEWTNKVKPEDLGKLRTKQYNRIEFHVGKNLKIFIDNNYMGLLNSIQILALKNMLFEKYDDKGNYLSKKIKES